MRTPLQLSDDRASHQDRGVGCSPRRCIPAPPTPSADVGVKESILSPSADFGTVPATVEELNITSLTPWAAMTLLTTCVKSMISEESQEPPTPPASSPTAPRTTTFPHTERGGLVASQDGTFDLPIRSARYLTEIPSQHKTPIGSPEMHPQDTSNTPRPSQLSLDDTPSESDYQCMAMAKMFQSKTPPPISLTAYLQRIHRYCPMSTAVYLAAAHYIQRITQSLWGPTDSEEKVAVFVQITPRSVHRLVLAALRIAMKVLEDHNWQHSRFAGVGGVPQAGLTRIELAMCYLLDFELFITKDALDQVAKWMVNNRP